MNQKVDPQPHDGSIVVEQATVISQEIFENQQYILHLHSPRIASRARPGQFIHLRCSDHLLMRRPYSIMSADNDGNIEILYKVVGEGGRQLTHKVTGDSLNCLGPIGKGFQLNAKRPIALLVGGGIGIPPIVFLANQAHMEGIHRPIVFMGSEVGFPYATMSSTIPVSGCGADVHLAMRSLEEKGIATRLATKQGTPGCYNGYLYELLLKWISTTDVAPSEIEIFACGPHIMLESIAQVAQRFAIPCQVSVEEYMACAVGGCAGCTISVKRDGEVTMQRVCVDGPVFNSEEIFWN